GFVENFQVMGNRCGSDASQRDDFSAAYALAGGDGLEDLEARPVGQSFRDFFNVRAVHWSCLSVTDLRCYPPQGLIPAKTPEIDATDYFDVHLSIELQKAGTACRALAAAQGFLNQRESDGRGP